MASGQFCRALVGVAEPLRDLAVLWHYRPRRPVRGNARLVVFSSLAAMERDAAMPTDVVEATARAMDRVVAGRRVDGMEPDQRAAVLRYRWRWSDCGNEGTVTVEPCKIRDGV